MSIVAMDRLRLAAMAADREALLRIMQAQLKLLQEENKTEAQRK